MRVRNGVVDFLWGYGIFGCIPVLFCWLIPDDKLRVALMFFFLFLQVSASIAAWLINRANQGG